jgi:membrane protein YqaA with SNARE-associated domain
LLLAWVSIIGDPLTFIAGVLRVNFLLFLILVSVGKISRYFFVYVLFS